MTETKEKQSAKQKILEPTFHYVTKRIKIGEDYTTDTIPVTELVKAGQRLLDFPNFDRLAEKGYAKAPFEAGDFTSANDQEHSIIASVYGYPKVQQFRKPESEGLISVISVEPLFKFSHDNMTVGLNIHPPLEGSHSLQNENLKKLIADHGISYGLIDSAIEEAEELIKEGEKEFRTIIIARGKPVGQSRDAHLRFDMEIGPIAGTILDDGSIDFRERKIMVPVKAGDTIATKIPPEQGMPGIDVFGEETPAPEGKDIKIELLNDVKYYPESKKVQATKDGVLSIVNKNAIKVCSHQVIRSDIDYETGNVESMNSVTVQGSVQPGFKVVVAGELKVTGSVMSATLSADSNLVVQGGITGKNSTIKSSGDADINFIEQGQLNAGGLVVVRKQSYYSDVISGGDIRCQKSSVVIGGRLIAEGSISVGDVGGEDSIPAIIAAGVVAERLDHFQDLKQQVINQQEEIIQWVQRYKGSSRSKKVRGMERDLENSKQLLLRLNMIPGSGKYSRVTATEPEQKNDPDFDNSESIDISKITIDVFGTVIAGTQLQIGNVTLRLDKTISGRRFKLHNNLKRILAVPLKK